MISYSGQKLILGVRLLIFILCLYVFHYSATGQSLNYTVWFEFNEHRIPDTAMLDLIKIITSDSMDKVEITGHCDSIGSKKYNYRLSSRRVQEVINLLSQNGLPRSVFEKTISYGKDKPLNDNSTAERRQENRRVEITFWKKISSVKKQEQRKVHRGEEQKSRVSISGDRVDQKKIIRSSVPIAKELEEGNFKRGNLIALPNLLFYGGFHQFLPEARQDLDKLLNILRQHPGLRVEIQGHVC